MLFKNVQCFYCVLPLVLIPMICAAYAYAVNARRPVDDPEKRDFHPFAIVLAPITWPLFILAAILIFILRALLFGVILILFVLVLIFARESTLIKRLLKKALSFGNKLLELNTALIRLFWKPRSAQPPMPKSPYSLDSLAGRFV